MIKSALKTYKDIKAWFDKANTDILAIDTELVDKNWLTMKLAGISFCDGKQACYIDLVDGLEDTGIVTYYLSTILTNTKLVIFHNAPFDLMVLYKYSFIVPDNIFCTMTAAHLIDENQRKGLKLLAQKYLGVTETIDWNEAITQGFHSHKFYNYALNDVYWTWKLAQIFIPELKRQGLWDLWYNIERPFQWCLRDLAINGIAVDGKKLLELHEQLRKEIVRLQLKMYEVGEIEYYVQMLLDGTKEIIPTINLNSSQQLVELITDKLKVELTETTDKGQLSTKNSVLKSVENKHEFIKLLLEYRIAAKILNSFLIPLPNLIQEDGRIRVNFMNTVAVTGRVSASRLHQLPKDNTGPVPVRQCFIAPPEKKLICADYAGQELRVLAHVSKDPTMIQAFKDKIDVHFLIANIFFDLKIPVEALVETHPDYKSYRKKFKAERDKIKAVNFGIAYGKSAYGFSKDWGIPEKEAKKFIDDYFKRFPKIKKAIAKCSYKTRQQKAIRNLTGRIRRFEWVDNAALRQSFNFLIQSASADMMKKAAGNVRQLCLEHSEWECLLVLTVHDELVWEINEQYVEEALPLIKEAMESAIELCIPVVVDINFGDNYQEAKP